ncbi:MAG: metallophosphoesterase family protein [Candidatus Diapherotrites archaeon]|nr:metallophosphoesterase family protein [Candidatus Diapherotrites archaeon]
MLALALSDIHSSLQRVQAANQAIHEIGVDLVLLLGDITQMGGAKEAGAVLDALWPAKILGFAGNFEMPEVQREMERRGISLHAAKKKIGKWTLAGFGGGLHGDPGRFLHSEAEIKKALGALLEGEKNAVLLTHLPPANTTLDLAHNGGHIGSAAVREIVEEFRPGLHLCGHCHEAAGEEKIAGTTSINVGAANEGKALLLELDGGLKWRKLQL